MEIEACSASDKRAIFAVGLLCFVLGSVHAFSIFLVPLETAFNASRANVSLVYSFALISLTISVLIGPKFFSLWPASAILLTSGLSAATGALIAAYAPNLVVVFIGYSLLFGAANGAGYGFGLQFVAQTNRNREGMAMGAVTACYAAGAMFAPGLFLWAISFGGFKVAMLGLTVSLVAVAVASAFLLRHTKAKLKAPVNSSLSQSVPTSEVGLLWIGYCTGVFSGLMIIGHAAEISRITGLGKFVWVAPTFIAGFSLVGSLLGGYMTDRLSPRFLVGGLSMFASVVLAVLTFTSSGSVVLGGLACVGFCYGAIISVYPSMIAKMFGMANSPLIYGRVFTAWGVAGLTAPWLAGSLFDVVGSYSIALTTAALLSLTSAIAMHLLFRRREL